MRVVLVLALVSQLLGAVEQAPGEGPEAGPEGALQLLFVGDSLTEQRGYPEACVRALEAAGMVVRWQRRARGGATPGDLVRWIEAEPLPKASGQAWAVVMAGTNGYRIEDHSELVAAVQGAGYQVAVVACPPRRNRKPGYGPAQANAAFNHQLTQRYTAMGALTAADQPVLFISEPPGMRDPDAPEQLHPALARDLVHLNDAGYRVLGEAVAAALVTRWLVTLPAADPAAGPAAD